MKTYYFKVLEEEITAQYFPSLKNADFVETLMSRIPDNPVVGQWEPHTLEDMRWNENCSCHNTYCIRDILKTCDG
jgi:hypothetical protein